MDHKRRFLRRAQQACKLTLQRRKLSACLFVCTLAGLGPHAPPALLLPFEDSSLLLTTSSSLPPATSPFACHSSTTTLSAALHASRPAPSTPPCSPGCLCPVAWLTTRPGAPEGTIPVAWFLARPSPTCPLQKKQGKPKVLDSLLRLRTRGKE